MDNICVVINARVNSSRCYKKMIEPMWRNMFNKNIIK